MTTSSNLCFHISCELRLPSLRFLQRSWSVVTYIPLREGPSCPGQESCLLPKHTASGWMHMQRQGWGMGGWGRGHTRLARSADSVLGGHRVTVQTALPHTHRGCFPTGV